MSLIAGLPDTFDELFDAYDSRLRKWGETQWFAQDADDAIQDTWMNLCQRNADSDPRDQNGNDWGYLVTCVTRAAMKKPGMPTVGLDPELYLPAPPECQFEEMIDGLEDDDADIVRRIYLNRETRTEIADSLGYKSHASVIRRREAAMDVLKRDFGMAT